MHLFDKCLRVCVRAGLFTHRKTIFGFSGAILFGAFAAFPVAAKDSSALLDGYFSISKALADDDRAAAKTAADSLARQAHSDGNHALAEHAGIIIGFRGGFSRGVVFHFLNAGKHFPDLPRTRQNQFDCMNIKYTLLTAVIAGAASLSTLSAQPGWINGKYATPTTTHGTSVTRAQHSCCEARMRQLLPTYRQGVLAKREIVCNQKCRASRIGKNCTSADCRQCS